VISKRLAVTCLLVSLRSICPADAQDLFDPSWQPETSFILERTFEPFARADNPQACREICLKDRRCTRWTYYHPDFVGIGPRETWEPLRTTCVIGAGLKERIPGHAGRTSGQIARRECPPLSGVPRSYMC
jgi:hypothetical protein